MKFFFTILFSTVQASKCVDNDCYSRSTCIENNETVFVLQESTISLQCKLQYKNEEQIIWTRKNQNRVKETLSYGNSLNHNITGNSILTSKENGSILEIRNIAENDNGIYCCEFDQRMKVNEKCTTLTLIEMSSNFGNNITEKDSGANITLSCFMANNFPQVNFSWIRNGSIQSSETTSYSNFTLKWSKEWHRSMLTCQAYIGSINVTLRHDVLLDVMYEPIVKISEVSPSSPEVGDEVTLKCSIDSNPVVTSVEWTKESEVLSTSSNLVIKNVGEGTNGLYQCTAKNTVGFSWDEIEISIKGLPAPRSQQFSSPIGIGIYIIGCSALIIVILMATVVYVLFRNRAKNADGSHYTKTDSTQEKVSVEIGYEEVAFSQGKSGKQLQNKRETVFEEVVFNPTSTDKRFTVV